MEFEWDESKRARVLEERGIDLLDAALIFEGFVVTTRDDRHDYGEERFRSIGVADGECYVVVHVRRGDAVRIVTAWKAGRSERSAYQARIARRDQGDETPG